MAIAPGTPDPASQLGKSVLENTFKDMHVDAAHADAFQQAMADSSPDMAADIKALKDQLSSIQANTTSGINSIQTASPDQLETIRRQLLDQVNALPSDPARLPGPAQENVSSDAMNTIKKEFENYHGIRAELQNMLSQPNVADDPALITNIQMKVGELHVMTSLFSQLGKKTAEIVSTLFKNQ